MRNGQFKNIQYRDRVHTHVTVSWLIFEVIEDITVTFKAQFQNNQVQNFQKLFEKFIYQIKRKR